MTTSPITAACQRLIDFAGTQDRIGLRLADIRALVVAAQRWAKLAPFLHVEHTQLGMYTTKRRTELVLHDDNGEPLEIRADHPTVEAFVDALPAPEEREGPQP